MNLTRKPPQQSKLIRDQTEQKVKAVENDANLVRETAQAKSNLVLTQAKSRVQVPVFSFCLSVCLSLSLSLSLSHTHAHR